MLQDKSRIITVEIEEELKRAYLEYSMSVIVSRALPDVRDGLKPSQRRILFAMHELNLSPGGQFRKCAKIAGDTSGNYHPHGEQVVYPTLVRMAQPWSMRYPLVDGQGNFGSIDGDPPAAMRYTEARLHKSAVDLMDDLEKETVDYCGNYDETRKEPTVFPSRFPNLICNGSSGIAVGMATNLAPHNLSEVCDGLVALIDDPEMNPLNLLNYIKGPDFPTGGYIIGKAGIIDYFSTGKGKLRVRGKAEVETRKDGNDQIIISEIPYQLNKTLLIERIVELVKEKRIEGISDIRDESGRQGMRLCIVVKRNADAETVLKKLYKFSQLQDTYSVNNLALVDGEPKILTTKAMLQNYIDFRHEIVIRRTKFELRNAEERMHILEGYRIALDNIDEVIATIRASKTTVEASDQLQAKFGLTEIQAKAILEMRLQRLTGLEREKIEQEYNEIVEKVKHLKSILEHHELRMDIIKQEVLEIKAKYGDARRTVVMEHPEEFGELDFVADEKVIVTISHDGYIKRVPINQYRNQGRGGKGISATNLKEEDFVQYIFVASTHSYMLLFTNFGTCYWLRVYEIPEGSRQARGKAVINLINLEKEEKVKAFVTVNDFDDTRFIIMATAAGNVKKTSLSAFSRPRTAGIKAIKLRENDELIDARITDGSNDIILATRYGYATRFNEKEIPVYGRDTQGVRGISLKKKDDYVISMVVVHRDGSILAICENGYGKRSPLEEYNSYKRGASGYITIKTNMRNGYLVCITEVIDSDDLIIVTRQGMVIRQGVQSISLQGRNTMGLRLINVSDDDKVFDITRITEDDRSADDGDETNPIEDENDKEIIDVEVETSNEDNEEIEITETTYEEEE